MTKKVTQKFSKSHLVEGISIRCKVVDRSLEHG